MSDQAFLDGYGTAGVEIELPDGTTARCKVLTVERVAYYLDLYVNAAEQGDGRSMLTIMKEFPSEVGLDGLVLTVGEVFDVLRAFFTARRPKRPKKTPRPTETTETPGPPETVTTPTPTGSMT